MQAGEELSVGGPPMKGAAQATLIPVPGPAGHMALCWQVTNSLSSSFIKGQK